MNHGLSLTLLAIAALVGSVAAAPTRVLPPNHPPPSAVGPDPLVSPVLFQSSALGPGRGGADDREFARKSLAELNADQPLADVLFDSNRATIRDKARAKVQQNAAWLKRWTTTAVTIEGHCDSRGNPELNTALGTSRAAAIKDALVALGVAPVRLAAIGKGRSQSFCDEQDVVDALEPPYPGCVACHLERCWQENRRGHFVITAK